MKIVLLKLSILFLIPEVKLQLYRSSTFLSVPVLLKTMFDTCESFIIFIIQKKFLHAGAYLDSSEWEKGRKKANIEMKIFITIL